MKAMTTSGLLLGGIAALLSPELMGKMTGREVFWLLIVALLVTSLGESLLPKIRERITKPEKNDEPSDTHER